jgi:hypothetical protein
MAGISHVFTISRVEEMLGEDEDLLQEISVDMIWNSNRDARGSAWESRGSIRTP